MSTALKCAIALGSNADPDIRVSSALLDRAILCLSRSRLKLLGKSNLYQTSAFPDPTDPNFVNAVILMEFEGAPSEILKELHSIEEILGRTRDMRWGQRKIDLDLLFVGQKVLPNTAIATEWIDMSLTEQMRSVPEQLILPHPRIQDRAFVLVPLHDVASEWVHPILGKSVSVLKSELSPEALADVRLFRSS